MIFLTAALLKVSIDCLIAVSAALYAVSMLCIDVALAFALASTAAIAFAFLSESPNSYQAPAE